MACEDFLMKSGDIGAQLGSAGPVAKSAPSPAPVSKAAPKTWKVDDMSIVVFFRSLSVLLGAGIPLVTCLSSLAKTVDKGDLQTICIDMARLLARGQTISASLGKFSPVFSSFQVNLVKVGEQTGTLNRVLNHIATHEEARQRLQQRVRSALVYPTVVAFMALIGLLVFPPFVLKGIFEVIRQSGTQPPVLTRVVMTLSSWLSSPILWVGLIAVVALSYRPFKRALSDARWRPLLMSVPGLGRCIRCATSARFASALALCLRAGLNIQSSLTLSAEATGDPLLQQRIGDARKAIEAGASITEGLKSIDFFTPLFLEFLGSGEEVGKADDMLTRLAAALECDLDQELQIYASLLEPLMLLAVGVVVGVLVIATAVPMMGLAQTLR